MTELRKQLFAYKRAGKDLKYLINYLFTIYDDEQKGYLVWCLIK